MVAPPHSLSGVHHHEDQDTIIYARRGHGLLIFEDDKKHVDLFPGDFALVPA